MREASQACSLVSDPSSAKGGVRAGEKTPAMMRSEKFCNDSGDPTAAAAAAGWADSVGFPAGSPAATGRVPSCAAVSPCMLASEEAAAACGGGHSHLRLLLRLRRRPPGGRRCLSKPESKGT